NKKRKLLSCLLFPPLHMPIVPETRSAKVSSASPSSGLAITAAPPTATDPHITATDALASSKVILPASQPLHPIEENPRTLLNQVALSAVPSTSINVSTNIPYPLGLHQPSMFVPDP